jgi:hypothetical protein
MLLKKFLTYSSYVIRHKWYVFLECCKLGIPIQGVIHDWHKLLPDEFVPYMNYFGNGIKTGRDKTGYYKPTDTGDSAFDYAWFTHVKRAKHHWQYWTTPRDADDLESVKVFEIPVKYRKEMVADWRGAGRAQGTPDVQKWYRANRCKLLLAPKTRKWIEHELGYPEDGYKAVGEAVANKIIEGMSSPGITGVKILKVPTQSV